LTLAGSDPDADQLTFRVLSKPSHGALSGDPPSLTYTPATNYFGPDSFTFLANDGALDSAPATITITVTPVNDAPTAQSRAISTPQGVAAIVVLSGADQESAPGMLSFRISRPPSHGDLVGATPELRYMPYKDFVGQDDFEFVVSDGEAESLPATISIQVTPSPNQTTDTESGERPVLSIQWLGSETAAVAARISFTAMAHNTYVIQTSSDLSHWTDLATSRPEQSGPVEFIDTAVSTASIRYYRLELRTSP
jgi:hypothetical protein